MEKKLVMIGVPSKPGKPRYEKLETRCRFLRERGWKIYKFSLREGYVEKIPIIGKILPAFIVLFKVLKKFRRNPNCIILTMNNPVPVHLVGLFAKKLYKEIKWIAEFRDAMLEEPFHSRKNIINRIIENTIEPLVISWSDRVVTTKGGQSTLKYFRKKYPREIEEKIERLPYLGFDVGKFEEVNPQNKFDRFTITYTGTFYKGWIDPKPFLEALQKFVKRKGISPRDLTVRFHTQSWVEDYEEILESLNLEDYVGINGFVSHNRMISILKRSHLLLYINGSKKTRKHMIHGKFYDYIGSGTPILGLADKGFNIQEIIKKYDLGVCAEEQDIDNMADALERAYSRYSGKNTIEDRDEEMIKKEFNRKKHDEAMLKVLNNLFSGR